jgi:hypothetical protein
MNITKAIRKALEHRADPPPNESTTCERVIYPLLLNIGYETRDILSRDADAVGKIPDYTLLPETPHTFYLEAKSWHVHLDSQHAVQAISYAHQNGKQWVVLTNGQTWQLYDDYIHGVAREKLVAEAHIENRKEAESFFAGISKESVCSGALPAFAKEEGERRERQEAEARRREEAESRIGKLRARLLGDLGSGTSPLVQGMVKHMNQTYGLGEITGQEIVDCLLGGPPPKAPASGTRQPPSSSDRVVVVAARRAWPEYLKFFAYICQANRCLGESTHIAYYYQGAVQRWIPRVLEAVETVKLSEDCVNGKVGLSEQTRARLLDLIRRLRAGGCTGDPGKEKKVVFLSSPNAPETIDIGGEIPNDCVTRTGKPWAFTVGQRYVSLARLRSRPGGTRELVNR